jgi:hypothetical protein
MVDHLDAAKNITPAFAGADRLCRRLSTSDSKFSILSETGATDGN